MPSIEESILSRLARLEEQVKADRIAKLEMKTMIEKMDSKLDDILVLKHKGQGVLWLGTILASVGGISLITQMVTWIGSLIGK